MHLDLLFDLVCYEQENCSTENKNPNTSQLVRAVNT